jgi:hexosaminidase
MKDIEYMVFPRLLGYAEIGWSAPQGRTWDGYKNRLAHHGSYMQAKNINFYPSKLVPWKNL